MTDRAEALRQRLLVTFRVEAEEHLHVINELLEVMTKEPAGSEAATRVEVLFRTMHTLKGAARSVGLQNVEEQCHRCETVLAEINKGRTQFTLQVAADLQSAVDAVAAELARDFGGEANSGAPVAGQEERSTSSKPPIDVPPESRLESQGPLAANRTERTARKLESAARSAAPSDRRDAPATIDRIRVEVDRLDRVGILVEDLVGPKLALTERLRTLRAALLRLAELRAALRATKQVEESPIELQTALRDIERMFRQQTTALALDHRILSSIIDELTDELRDIRMIASETIFAAIPRTIRDLCHQTGKEVVWNLEGGELEIDRKVLDQLKDPLLHIVRNAVDHGIESPAEREAAGKPRIGSISAKVSLMDGGRVEILISDDGRGFSMELIKDAILRARIVSADKIAELSPDRICALAFQAGVSTSPVITNISGRGLGLAIVQDYVERLEGHVSAQSMPGQGTMFRIDVPASIATHRGLLLKCGDMSLLCPSESVEGVFRIQRSEIAEKLAQGLVSYGGEALPLARLSVILGIAAQHPVGDGRQHVPCFIVTSGERRAVLCVDSIEGSAEVVIKPLRPPLTRVRNVSAAGVLGTGELALVLRPADLLASVGMETGDTGAGEDADYRIKSILVVDDSITTRTMERSLFEGSGYSVKTAVDGQEAWNILQSESFDLVVSDIDMPNLDGFDLTARIRQDQRLAELPVVLVTALEARDDMDRGVRVGANAYVLKSTFDQANLLEIVNRLI